MKTLILLTIMILVFFHLSMAQTGFGDPVKVSKAQPGQVTKSKTFQVWVKTPDILRVKPGVLYDVQDSSIRVSSTYRRGGAECDLGLTRIESKHINVVQLRRKHTVVIGIIAGGLTGAAAGIAGGYLVHNPNAKNEFVEKGNAITTVIIPILSTAAGVGLGAAIGSTKISIPVRRSQAQFNEQKFILNNYAVNYESKLGGKNFKILLDTLVDADGNAYHTIALGAQVWMAKELVVLHFQDGSEIPCMTGDAAEPRTGYDWFAVSDSRKICPAGWHVPSAGEWASLVRSLGSPYSTARSVVSGFINGGTATSWWSSTEQDTTKAQSFILDKTTNQVMITPVAKTSRLPARCIRDW